MYFQPKVLEEFLRVVLQYEYLKNRGNPRQAHKNISELLILDNIRRNMIGVHPPDTPPHPSSSTTSTSSVFSIESMSDDVFQSESAGTPSEDGQVTSFDSTYGNPLNSPGPLPVIPWTWIPINAVFNRDELLKEDEDDDMVQNVEFEEVERVFRDLEHGFMSPPVKIETQRLSALREKAFTIINLSLFEYKKPVIKDPKDKSGAKTKPAKHYKHPFDRLKTVTDHTEIRIQLSDSKQNAKNMNIVYWKVLHGSMTGCMLWENDAVRFVEELDFENLASSEFIHILNYSTEIKDVVDSVPPAVVLDNLEMLIAKKKKWRSPWSRYHGGDFFRATKKWMKKCGRKQDYLSFPLRKIRADALNAITIRVWDDSHILPVGRRTLLENLEPLDSTDQWENARFLDIEDPNLVGWIPKVGLFQTVHLWEVTQEGLQRLMEIHGPPGLPAMSLITVKTGYNNAQRDFGIVRRP
ncbi:unnamed protein product [Caenorhabditis brenneri]